MKTVRSADSTSLLPGTQMGSWRVKGQHGSGSYGVVYRVEKVGQEDAGPFALKVAKHPLDPRFEREGELLSRIHHPHVPRFEARGWVTFPGGVPFPYVVMEWVFDHAWCVSSQVSFSGVRVVGRRRSCCSRSLRRRVSSLRSA